MNALHCWTLFIPFVRRGRSSGRILKCTLLLRERGFCGAVARDRNTERNPPSHGMNCCLDDNNEKVPDTSCQSFRSGRMKKDLLEIKRRRISRVVTEDGHGVEL